ncbi:hypothetical protein DESUT3_33160 [Desulfuromonas versatilis]|uniref:Nickel transport protein n=1 Tax=Desulfuromonas versatilis TaxID=2802975 RepID=A0ABM8HWD8_9BACT|nr:hypothetical protein [Desulfuromonas versatilis]BCR06247.1 hypothetical protein DESUT3_33160 [Desulfuromonas versatilis]
MSGLRRVLLLSVLALALLGPARTAGAEEAGARDGAAAAQQDNEKLSAELRRIHREIAALRADLDKPGMEDVFAGLGYIFGLFGVAAFVASRRKGE